MDSLLTTADQLPAPTHAPDLAKLEFSYNWNNKLDCWCYTTIRMANPGKYQLGRKFGVYLKGKRIHDAEIIEVKLLKIDQISEWIARLDIGYSRDKCIEIIKKMYQSKPINWQTQNLNYIILRRIDYNGKYKG